MREFSSKELIEEYLDAEKAASFLELAKKANTRFNLYSRNLAQGDLIVLLAESLIPLKIGWLDNLPHGLLDIGSGWGIPAVPWRLAGFEGELVLLERSQKKADFLLLLANRLNIELDIVCRDLEKYRPDRLFSVFSFRGVALTDDIIKSSKTLAASEANLISFGPLSEERAPGSAELYEYRIDNLPTRKLHKIAICQK